MMTKAFTASEVHEIVQRQKVQSTILWICGYLEGAASDSQVIEEIKEKIVSKLIEAFPYIAEYLNQTEDDNDE